MEVLLGATCALSLQTILGAAAWVALSATLAPALRTGRGALRAPVLAAAPAGAAALGLGWLAGADPAGLLEPVRVWAPGLVTVAGAAAATGCHLVLHAARLESAGAAETPGAMLRDGGKIMFAGAVLLAAPALLAFVSGGASAGRSMAGVAGALACAAGGFGGLLAGLSAKPLPSGPIAAVVYACGFVLLCAATRSS